MDQILGERPISTTIFAQGAPGLQVTIGSGRPVKEQT
jgi:hypothetical protein